MAPFTTGTATPITQTHRDKGAPGAYYTIVRDEALDGKPFTVWARTGSNDRAEVVGQFKTLEEAKRSAPLDWRDAKGKLLVAWAFQAHEPASKSA